MKLVGRRSLVIDGKTLPLTNELGKNMLNVLNHILVSFMFGLQLLLSDTDKNS